MTTYAINDKVTLAAARGGWSGFVAGIVGGPGETFLYRIISPNMGNIEEGAQLVSENDIAAGPLTAPEFTDGQAISLYGMSGTITEVHGDGTFDVEVEHVQTNHLTLTRLHSRVPLWRIAIENNIGA